MSSKSSKKIILLIVLVLAVAAGAYMMRGPTQPPPKKASADQGVPVKVATAMQGDVDLALRVIGRAEAYSTVTMRSRVDGQVQSLHFVPGAKVSKGELIAQIDPRLLQAQLEQARGNVARDQAQLAKARADNARYTEMLGKGYVSKADFDTFRANLGVAEAALQTDIAARDLAQTQLDYARITAPFDAVAGAPLVYPGAIVTADTTDMVVLNEISPIRIAFSIPEDSLPAVRAALTRGSLGVDAKIAGDHGTPLHGELEFIDNAVNTTTGTILLKGRFTNEDGRLTSGQFAEVSMPTTRIANAITIPVVALQSSSNGAFVFVVGSDNRVKQRPVTAGPVTVDRVVIDKGLAAGERVVTDGQLLLIDGAAVKVQGG